MSRHVLLQQHRAGGQRLAGRVERALNANHAADRDIGKCTLRLPSVGEAGCGSSLYRDGSARRQEVFRARNGQREAVVTRVHAGDGSPHLGARNGSVVVQHDRSCRKRLCGSIESAIYRHALAVGKRDCASGLPAGNRGRTRQRDGNRFSIWTLEGEAGCAIEVGDRTHEVSAPRFCADHAAIAARDLWTQDAADEFEFRQFEVYQNRRGLSCLYFGGRGNHKGDLAVGVRAERSVYGCACAGSVLRDERNVVAERDAGAGIGSRRHIHGRKQLRSAGKRAEINCLSRVAGVHGRVVGSIGRKFDLVQGDKHLFVLVAESVRDVHFEGRAASG